MSKFLLVLFFVTSSAFAGSDRAMVRENVATIASVIGNFFKFDEERFIKILRAAEKLEDYDTCTNPGWFTSKQTQSEACMRVARYVEQNKFAPAYSEAELQRLESRFKEIIAGFSDPQEQNAAQVLRNAIINNFNEHHRSAQNEFKRAKEYVYDTCFPLKLADSIKCGFREYEEFAKRFNSYLQELGVLFQQDTKRALDEYHH